MGRILADSNVILKYLEGNRDIGRLFAEHEVYYNDIIFSEVLYSAIRHVTGKRPYDIKKNPETIAEARDIILAVRRFFKRHLTYVIITQEIVERATGYSVSFHLLPNDALILATAEEYEIEYIATYDTDMLRLRNVPVQIVKPDDLL